HRAARPRPPDRLGRVRRRDDDSTREGRAVHRPRGRLHGRRGDPGEVLHAGDPARGLSAHGADAAPVPRRRRAPSRGAPERAALSRRLAEVEPRSGPKRGERGPSTRLPPQLNQRPAVRFPERSYALIDQRWTPGRSETTAVRAPGGSVVVRPSIASW